MIKVVAKLTIKKEGIDIFIENAKKLVEETRKEEGCISYQLLQDINNEQVFIFNEEWASAEALDKHMKSEHFALMQEIQKQIQEEGEINILKLVK